MAPTVGTELACDELSENTSCLLSSTPADSREMLVTLSEQLPGQHPHCPPVAETGGRSEWDGEGWAVFIRRRLSVDLKGISVPCLMPDATLIYL